MMAKPKRGRPATGRRHPKDVHLRMDAATHAAALRAAHADDRLLSDWVRVVVRRELVRLGWLTPLVVESRPIEISAAEEATVAPRGNGQLNGKGGSYE